jgi:U3 small nucleolar RNA-associated protein 4
MMSFWDREVHIWRLVKPLKSIPELEDLESEPAAQNRKLVAKILIKGEANITSATLSANGDLLAVSTVLDIKVFELRARKSEEGDGLRIIKVDVPSSFSSGARLVRYSPDNKWLCIIRPDNKIFLSRTLTSTSSSRPLLTKLERINRKIEKHISLGGLGTYDRIITQVEFSSDSRILAVSDLAGYIDTFVLSGAEDLSLASNTLPNNAASSSSSSSSESDQEPDSEDDKPNLTFGQHWTRNPSAAFIPRLPSAPTILSFRPSTNGALTNGNGTTHAIPTRHNPNPISHDLPTGEDRLLVVTATSEIYEFDILRGALSSWSRRNPTSVFPEEFRKVRDLARGCVWDVSSGRERVWLYGVGWLWMFDLLKDFPCKPRDSANATLTKKRKRHGKKEASGAGSMIPDRELGTGISRTMQRIVHEEVDEVEAIAFHDDDDDMDLDSESDADHALTRFQRGEGKQGSEEQGGEEQNYWRTFKYRPILGICVIGDPEEGSDIGPEVALVERPIWEADLGPRYFGEQEWEKNGVDL